MANGSVASLLAATLYQGNSDRNHKLWNIVSTERYILHIYAGAAGMFTMGNWNHLFCRKVSFLTTPRDVWSRPTCICGFLYFKLNGIDVINEITKPRIIYWKDIIDIAELNINRWFGHNWNIACYKYENKIKLKANE